ncbi:hypothetical protein TGS27_2309 [Geobacillus stearothermophilus]|uniref:Uncharacterized protein n=1 Tax=Geobacillus stearothermophilus TaxID=1422 RepID=A0ABQ7HDP7_GEOSE|nr:hypothetical protein GS8_2492 [Geobacillus stearothermophilus]OAO78940.1 hypothetical protein TGS27_2309 [Geobacillus stearothermophilus]
MEHYSHFSIFIHRRSSFFFAFLSFLLSTRERAAKPFFI